MKVFEVMPLAHVPFSESWFKADKADVICRELHERIRKGEVEIGDLFYIYEYSTFEWQDEKASGIGKRTSVLIGVSVNSAKTAV